MKGREHNRKKSTNGSKKRTTYEDLKRKSKGETSEFVAVPENAMGFVIGKKGNTIKQIQEKSGAKITQTDSHPRSGFMVYGNEDQRVCAKELINKKLSSREGESSNQGGFKKLGIKIPDKFIGQVIGRGREKLNTIETKTGVALKFIDNSLYVKGSTEKEKKAVLEIKAIVKLAKKRLQSHVRVARFVHVDTTQLEENHEFELSEQQRFKANSGEKCFKLKLLEHPLQEETSFDSAGIESLKENVLQVLKQIHKEKDEEMVKVDMWCHFGHAYITKVDENEEQETFTAKDIKEKVQFGGGKSWTPFFKDGAERMEVERIEKSLTSRAAKDDRRYDFTFYTPSCREVRVKTWLLEEHSLEEDTGACAPSLAFSRSPPVPVKNTLTRVLSEEHVQTGDASNTPCFHMCSEFHHRMKVDILILSKGLDCRLIIRTGPNVSKIPEDEEEDKILESYLMGMKIEGDQLVLPPVSERPDGFELFFQRRSLRRTYQYEIEEEQFSLTVCKDQPINVDTGETDARNGDESPAMTDIHLHCEEWDRVLDEGNWEPEQIVAKLPTFLKFLRQVQRNVVPLEYYE